MVVSNTQETDLNRILNLLFYDVYFENYLDRITSHSLTRVQFSVLNILKYSGSLLVSAIADILHISRAAASKNIDYLVRLKLVQRKIEKRDRRKSSISLLPSGEKIVADFEHLCIKKQKNALSSFSKKEQLQLSELLIKYIGGRMRQEEEFDLICPICNGCLRDECILVNHNVICQFNQE